MGMTHEERADRRREIAKYCRQGHTLTEAAKHFGVSASLARLSCIEYGSQAVSPPSTGGGPAVSSLRVLKLLLDRVSRSDICERFGVSRQYVQQVVENARKAGFKIHV
jgi:transposase